MNRLGALLLASSVLALAACATPKAYVQPTATPLQDPPAGKALVYLLRAPYDEATLTLTLNGIKVAELPAERYTAVQVVPGTHTLATHAARRWSEAKEAVPPFTFNAQADTRYFLSLPAPERKLSNGLLIGSRLAVPYQEMVETGAARGWEQTTERDAQWFMFHTKPMSPEPGAL